MNDAGVIDASTEPTLVPGSVNLLLVYTACAIWASRGGMKDPKPFERKAQLVWVGDGQTHFGVLGMFKMQNAFQGLESFPASPEGVLGGVDTGAGYTAL